jgi:hypothetical protein
LIYAGRKDGAAEELKKGLAEGMDATVQHGAALGYGISAVSSADEGTSLQISSNGSVADSQTYMSFYEPSYFKTMLFLVKVLDTPWVSSCLAQHPRRHWTK